MVTCHQPRFQVFAGNHSAGRFPGQRPGWRGRCDLALGEHGVGAADAYQVVSAQRSPHGGST